MTRRCFQEFKFIESLKDAYWWFFIQSFHKHRSDFKSSEVLQTKILFFHSSPSRWCLNYISFNEWNLIRLPGQERVCDHNEVFLPVEGKYYPKINKIRAPAFHCSIFFGDKMWRSKCQPDSGHQGSQRWEEIPSVQIALFQFPLFHSDPVLIIDRITISVEES